MMSYQCLDALAERVEIERGDLMKLQTLAPKGCFEFGVIVELLTFIHILSYLWHQNQIIYVDLR